MCTLKIVIFLRDSSRMSLTKVTLNLISIKREGRVKQISMNKCYPSSEMTMLIHLMTLILKLELLSTLIKVVLEDVAKEAIIKVTNKKALNLKTLRVKVAEVAAKAKFKETISI